MKREWTEATAVAYLTKFGGDVELTQSNKLVIGAKGLSGLKACGAFDFLKAKNY